MPRRTTSLSLTDLLGKKGGPFLSAIWAILIGTLLLSEHSGEALPWWTRFDHSDKLVHFGLFLVQGYLLAVSVGNGRFPILIIALCAVFGGVLEILQETLTETRSGSMADLLADAIGAAVGLVIYRLRSEKYPA